MIVRAALAMLPLALLAACGGGGDADGGSASGKVLEGTISDEMLPLDTVRAQAPLAGPAADGKGKKGAAAGAEGEPGEEGEDAATDAPAEAPSADAAPGPADPIGDAVSGGE